MTDKRRMGTEPVTFAAYWDARCEHAWLLRAEGLTFREIGQRIGITDSRAQQMVRKFGRIVQGAINRQRAIVAGAARTQQWAIAYQQAKLQAEADRWIKAWISQQ